MIVQRKSVRPGTRRVRVAIAFLSGLCCLAGAAMAWDAPGHRAITLLALDNLAADAPAFLREDLTRRMIASQSCEPDRWRAGTVLALTHVNNPDHYIDLEDLAPAGLSLATLPEFRYEYIAAMTRAEGPGKESEDGAEPRKDKARVYMTPGTLPYAIAENYGRLQAAFKTLRILESLNDPARAAQVEQARANIVSIMGVLSHFVGDAAQPLHTTRHHHGWVGENPKDYTTRYSFHAEIDGGVLEFHGLRYETLKTAPPAAAPFDASDPMAGIRSHLERSFREVETLYALDKDGGLLEDKGKALITARLTDAGSMLATLYNSAWQTAAPTDDDVRNFIRFDKFDADAPPP